MMSFLISLIVAIIIGWLGSLFVKGDMPGGNYRVYDRRSYWRLDRTRAAWNMGAAPSRICHYSSGNRRSHCCLSSKPVNQKKRIKAAAPEASALWVFVLP
ncbi:hypothetical protein ACVW0X_003852 [Bacillus subtilis]